jgi:hypothetical protein
VLGATIVLVVCAALLVLGRATANHRSAHDAGYRAGRSDGYSDGLQAGLAEGRREGRALQAGLTAPTSSRPSTQAMFNAGYAAGANDVFGSFDGGWALSTPYVITLERGSNGISYRITSRDQIADATDYFLCPDGVHLCHQPR